LDKLPHYCPVRWACTVSFCISFSWFPSNS
jgi:hypothetical protein